MAWSEKLPSGRYRGCYRDAAGNKRTTKGATYAHKAAAERAAAALEEKARRRNGPEVARNITWAEWSTDWLDVRAVEASTARTNASQIRVHLMPYWGSVKLATITRNDVKRWVAHMRKKGVGATSVQRNVHLFSASLNAAIDEELLEINPAYRLKLEKGPLAQERYLEVEEYEAILDQMPTARDRLVMKMLANTGLRWGELAGLHWNRLDLARGQVGVIETWSEAGRVIKAYPKGRRARIVPVPGWLISELKEQVIPIGGCGHPHASGTCRSGLVFTTAHDNVLHHSKWSELWRQAVEDSGVGHTRIHDLRHTYASWLLQSGKVSLAEVGQLLGHVDPKTTQKYAHLAKKPATGVLGALPAPRLRTRTGTDDPPLQVKASSKVEGQPTHTRLAHHFSTAVRRPTSSGHAYGVARITVHRVNSAEIRAGRIEAHLVGCGSTRRASQGTRGKCGCPFWVPKTYPADAPPKPGSPIGADHRPVAASIPATGEPDRTVCAGAQLEDVRGRAGRGRSTRGLRAGAERGTQ